MPLGNTPSRVMTTGWSTLKSRAMAETSEGASTAGSDTVTSSISSSWPAPGTEERYRSLPEPAAHLLRCQHADCGDDRLIQGEGGCSEKEDDSGKDATSALWFWRTASSKRVSARVCAFLITNEPFITQEINEKTEAVKGKKVGFFFFLLHLRPTQVLLLTPR